MSGPGAASLGGCQARVWPTAPPAQTRGLVSAPAAQCSQGSLCSSDTSKGHDEAEVIISSQQSCVTFANIRKPTVWGYPAGAMESEDLMCPSQEESASLSCLVTEVSSLGIIIYMCRFCLLLNFEFGPIPVSCTYDKSMHNMS